MALKNPYAKGYRNEKKSRELLEQQGYCVIEARGSHGLWDLVAIRVNDQLVAPDLQLVQCKTNRPASKADMMAMRGVNLPFFVRRYVHIWYDYAKQPEIIEVK